MPSEYDIEVHVGFPSENSLANVEITAVPLDLDSLRDSIARESQILRPQFQELESDLASYAFPDLTGLEETLAPWQAIYDSVRNLADSLNRDGPDSSDRYTAAYARLRNQYQRLAQSTVQRDAAMQELVGDDRDLAMRAAAAADSLRAWEGVALASFPERVDSALSFEGRALHRTVTGENGVAEFTLTPGRWWFIARRTNPDNPFLEYYWNQGMRIRLIGSKSVVLDSGNVIRRWRY